MKRFVVFAHLLNDYSGSPRVLKNVILAINSEKTLCLLYVGYPAMGVLSDCAIPVKNYWYRRLRNRWGTLVTFSISQLILFGKLLFDRSIPQHAIIYVNTLLPFGAALYGKLTGRKVIYHIHEISVTPAPLKALLTGIVRRTSCLNLYVSDTHQQTLPIAGVPAQRIYNVLDTPFIHTASASIYAHRRDGIFRVLMIASLRDYKGIPEFMALVSALADQAQIYFELVLNEDSAVVDRYFADQAIPATLAIHPRTRDTSTFYGRASLLLNLSRVDQCIETFGMTILEAMAFGIPVIVPPVGGPAELVEDGRHGYWVDSRDHTTLCRRVLQLAGDEPLCRNMSDSCRKRSVDFSQTHFANSLNDAIGQVLGEKA